MRGSVAVLIMSDLAVLYQARLKSLGCNVSVLSTRLRHELANGLPDVKAVERSKSYDLIFDNELENAVDAIKSNSSDDMKTLSQAAIILRRDIYCNCMCCLDLSNRHQKGILLYKASRHSSTCFWMVMGLAGANMPHHQRKLFCHYPSFSCLIVWRNGQRATPIHSTCGKEKLQSQ